MSGFSHEIELPFNFGNNLDYSHPTLKGHQEGIELFLDQWFNFPMIKGGIIGRCHTFRFKNSRGFAFYVDNSMHYGASGGPVINDCGELIGIITKRAVTIVEVPREDNKDKILKVEIPSGSTYVISPHTMIEHYKKETGQNYPCEISSSTQ